MVGILRALRLVASAEESARFERARRAAKTSCAGLLEGHILESNDGRTEAV